jgi:hypothetical protein
LFELARPESEIARINFVTKRFANLRDAEWQLLARNFKNVFELNKDRLGCLRTQISNRTFVRCSTDMRLKHQVELSRRS